MNFQTDGMCKDPVVVGSIRCSKKSEKANVAESEEWGMTGDEA